MPDLIPLERIENKILIIRGQKVLLDRDLAELYGVNTKRLNEQVKRNIKRFPQDFMFQLTKEEKNELVANCDRFNLLKHSNSLPYAFTEHGAMMTANILNSVKAIDVSVLIVRAFIKMREMISTNAVFAKKLAELEERLDQHDENTLVIMATLRRLISKPEEPKKQKIGFLQ